MPLSRSNVILDIIDYCHICGKDNDDSQMILCDKCDKGYHIYCLTPPLSEIPKGDWVCVTCLLKNKKKYVKGSNCEICGKSTLDDKRVCIKCGKMYHIYCYKIKTDFYSTKWTCSFCEGYRNKKCHLEESEEWCLICDSKSPENELFRCSCCSSIRHKNCPDPETHQKGCKIYNEYMFCDKCYFTYLQFTLFGKGLKIELFKQEFCTIMYELFIGLTKNIINELLPITNTIELYILKFI